MNVDKNQIQTPENDAELTLVDIEELRNTLGAEAEVVADFGADVSAVRSTVMCPSHPWDR